jgi:hypothetical protein
MPGFPGWGRHEGRVGLNYFVTRGFWEGRAKMVLECKVCKRVKKFGEWIEASYEFRELVREIGVEVTYVVCPHCEEEVLAVGASQGLARRV